MDNRDALINTFEMLVNRISDIEERLRTLHENDQVMAASAGKGQHVHGSMFGFPFVLIKDYEDYNVNDVVIQVTLKDRRTPFEPGSVLRRFVAGDEHLRKALSQDEINKITNAAARGTVPTPADCGIYTSRFTDDLERFMVCRAVAHATNDDVLLTHRGGALFVIGKPDMDLIELAEIVGALLPVVGIPPKDVKCVRFRQSTKLMTELYRVLSKDMTFEEHMCEARAVIKSYKLILVRAIISRTEVMLYRKDGTQGMAEAERQMLYSMLEKHSKAEPF